MSRTRSIYITLTALALSFVIIIAGLLINQSAIQNTDTLTQAEVTETYRGKTLRILVPSQPGGGFDAYGRLLAPFLEKYTGATVRVVNLPGAGGMRATNELYNSPNDGLSLAIIGGSSMILNKLAGIKGADYEIETFKYLGRIVADSRVLFVSKASGLDSFNDILTTGQPVRFGATGLGGNGYVDGVISKTAFGLNTEIIHGFDTLAGVTQSVKRGNLDGAWGPWGSVKPIVSAGTEKVVVQSDFNRHPELQDVPTVFEYIDNTNQPGRTREILLAWNALNTVGRVLAAPPETPAGKVTFLRDAFNKAIHDQDFIVSTKRSDLPVLYANAEDTLNIIIASTTMDPKMNNLFIRAVRGEL